MDEILFCECQRYWSQLRDRQIDRGQNHSAL